MWCQKGECVQQNRSALQPVDGGWSGWERWGPCSRSCGGGIKKSERACSSPAPSNGGKYCVGERVRFKSCRKMDCPVGSRDFREVQCAQFNNNTFSIPDVPPDVKWVPSYSGISQSDRCKLFCRISHSGVHYLLGDKVKDGTTCDRDTYDVCINGVCHAADCSHTINPTKPLDVDICGKCGGDNSTCRMVRGEYNVSSYGYRRVVLIPAGSYNLDIKQSGHRGTSKDDNYLALVNPDTGDHLLNGNFIVSLFRKLIVYGVTRIEYSGSNAATERINSSGPLSKDLILEVLSVGKLYPPNIHYQYTVQRSRPEYRWELKPEWTRCSSECQGEQFKKQMCIKDSTGFGEIVRDELCSHLTRPRHLVQLCNTHCILRWKVAHETPCSAHTCTKTRIVECVREVPSRNGVPSQVQAIDQGYCRNLAGKPQFRIPCQMSCRAEWKPTEWSPCSATCGEGIQRRKFVCMDSNGQETVQKFCKGGKYHGPEEQKCKVQECPRWATGEWTPCSVTCGSGEQQRPYWCELEGKAVAEGYCRSHVGDSNGIPVHVQKCKALPCPYLSDRENWIQEEAPLPTAHPSSSSSPLVSPTTALALPRTPAPPSSRWSYNPDHRDGYLPSLPVPRSSPNFRWRAGLWGPCTQTCKEEGGSDGYLRRLVACHDEHGRDADDSLCPNEDKPIDVISCKLPICPKWVHGEWAPCNVSCGEGRQFREVRCIGSEGQALAETKCSPLKKPLSTKVCAAASCPTWQSTMPRQREPKFMWNAWHWEKCSTTCGPGFQRRKVACVRVSRSGSGDPEPLEPPPAGPGPPHYCHVSLKPAEHQRCQISECGPQFRWKTGRWKPCSEPCGKKGKQRRVVSCIKFKPDGQTKRVPKQHCPQSSKPHTRQKCNRHSCDYSSCELIREAKWRQHGRNLNLRDGEYHLLISGFNMQIYCHGMGIRTNLPKEYLTLPAGERDNFSEFYDRRLLNPNTCPDGGLRRDDCDCTIDSNGKGGVTVFSRLRINVTSLKIDTSDMTFARQLQGSKVAFGRAGDCYSSLDCPQGRFSINLVGTRLRVHEDVKWEGSGPSASVHIDRRENGQSIIGRCGGYCGACQPAGAPWIALDILPARNEGGLR